MIMATSVIVALWGQKLISGGGGVSFCKSTYDVLACNRLSQNDRRIVIFLHDHCIVG